MAYRNASGLDAPAGKLVFAFCHSARSSRRFRSHAAGDWPPAKVAGMKGLPQAVQQAPPAAVNGAPQWGQAASRTSPQQGQNRAVAGSGGNNGCRRISPAARTGKLERHSKPGQTMCRKTGGGMAVHGPGEAGTGSTPKSRAIFAMVSVASAAFCPDSNMLRADWVQPAFCASCSCVKCC